MTARKTEIGLSLFCALMVCALGASSAAASPEEEGTTLVTCKKGGTTHDFKAAHCRPADASPEGTFSHFAVPVGQWTEIEGTNEATKNETKEKTPAILTSTVGGVEIELSCSTVSSKGEAESEEMASGPIKHTIVGKNGTISYSSCTVPKPAGQECKIKEGKITTNSLKSISEGMSEVFTPTTGTSFVTITIEGCKSAALNGAKNVTGSVKAVPDGATLNVNIPKNASSTLQFGGQAAGLTLSETLRGRVAGTTGATEPLSTTTTPLVLGG